MSSNSNPGGHLLVQLLVQLPVIINILTNVRSLLDQVITELIEDEKEHCRGGYRFDAGLPKYYSSQRDGGSRHHTCVKPDRACSFYGQSPHCW